MAWRKNFDLVPSEGFSFGTRRRLVFAFLVALSISFRVEAATYFLATGGDDSNPGTRSRPWRLLQKSVWKMEPGDTLVIRGGVYREFSYADLRTPSTGKISTIRAEKSETVVFDGRVPATEALKPDWKKIAEHVWRTETSGRWRGLDGLWVDGKYYPLVGERAQLKAETWFHKKDAPDVIIAFPKGKSPFNSKLELRLEAMITFDTPFWQIEGITARYFSQCGIGAWKTHHITIRDCEAHHNGGGGIETVEATDLLIEGNKTYSNGSEGGRGWSSGIHIFAPTSDSNVIRNNISYSNWDPSDHHTDGNGLSIDKGYAAGGAEVYNNIAFQNGGRGIDVMETANVKIHHNTFFNNSRDPAMDNQGEISFYGKVSETGLKVFDNILFATRRNPPIVIWKDFDPTKISCDFNLLFNRDNTKLVAARYLEGKTENLRLEEWRSISGEDRSSASQNPKLVDPDKEDFRPTRESWVVGQGSDTFVPKVDYFGKPRPPAKQTIGAIEPD